MFYEFNPNYASLDTFLPMLVLLLRRDPTYGRYTSGEA